MRLLSIHLIAEPLGTQSHRRIVLLSVYGLDHRYLQDCDKLGLKIPNIRRMMREGTWAKSVVGEVPIITWLAHTAFLAALVFLHGQHCCGLISGRRRQFANAAD